MPPAIGIAAAVIGAGAAVAGTIGSISAASKQRDLTKQAQAYERQRNDLQSALQKRDAIRSARQNYASAQQNSENQGVAASSIAEGGQGSIVSQVNSNLSFLDTYGYLTDQASQSLGKAQDAQYEGTVWGGIANIGKEAFAAAGGTSAFKGPKPPNPTVAIQNKLGTFD